MTCLVTTHPLWQYFVALTSFGVGTWGTWWFARDFWRHRAKWYDRPLVGFMGILSLGSAWVTIAVGVNIVLYIHALSQGMPRC